MNDCGQKFEQLWLPLWPYASDDLKTGIFRMSRESALERRYIEANPHAISNLLVVDVDHEDALLRTMWNRGNWLPNAVVENPSNGHAHAVWALQEPITRTEYARRKPLAYAAAVTEGLRRSVDGDKAYSGLITKNPEHEAWDAWWLTNHLYTLAELDHYLTDDGSMPAPGWKTTRRRTPIGLGRNCSLFETARTWAYPRVRAYTDRTPAASNALRADILTYAHQLNTQFSEPLPASEVRAIGTSIHKWITTRSRMWLDGAAVYEATFTLIQSARGHKSAQKRRTSSSIHKVMQ